MFGSKRRRIGVAIGLAAVAAAVAIVALGSGGSSAPDPTTIAINRLCHTARGEIEQAMQQDRSAFDSGNPSPLARVMFDAVGELQSQLGTLNVPTDKIEATVELRERLIEAETPILRLIKIPPRKRIPADAKELESIEAEVKSVASDRGFDECARLSLSLPPLPS